MNKKAQGALEWIMTYGWAILVVLVAIGALWYFDVFTPKHDVLRQRTYDCGNIYVKGMEGTVGELQNASFALKTRADQPLNESTFSGRFLKAYYDLDNCFAVSELGNGTISLQ